MSSSIEKTMVDANGTSDAASVEIPDYNLPAKHIIDGDNDEENTASSLSGGGNNHHPDDKLTTEREKGVCCIEGKGVCCCTKNRLCTGFCFCLVLAAVVICVWYFAFFVKQDTTDDIAYCGTCHCIPDEDAGETCPPAEERPRSNFTQAEILNWGSQIPINAYELNCNPYQIDLCDTEPSLIHDYDDYEWYDEDAVCGIHYMERLEDDGDRVIFDNGHSNSNTTNAINATNATNSSITTTNGTYIYADTTGEHDPNMCKFSYYYLRTYKSWKSAEQNGAFVTHVGACGVCSTMQDLAAYVASTDLTTQGEVCAKQGTISFDLGKQCYQDLGMTESCAKLWSFNSWNTATNCIKSCLTTGVSDEPNNGPAPHCELNECLQCDEEKSGPIFKKFGGRTRRRSGLLSAIVRPCNQIVSQLVQDPCPKTTPLA